MILPGKSIYHFPTKNEMKKAEMGMDHFEQMMEKLDLLATLTTQVREEMRLREQKRSHRKTITAVSGVVPIGVDLETNPQNQNQQMLSSSASSGLEEPLPLSSEVDALVQEMISLRRQRRYLEVVCGEQRYGCNGQ